MGFCRHTEKGADAQNAKKKTHATSESIKLNAVRNFNNLQECQVRHHPKSNNGVFSKKQKKASRMMMATRSGFMPTPSQGLSLPTPQASLGVLPAVLGLLLGRRGRGRG